MDLKVANWISPLQSGSLPVCAADYSIRMKDRRPKGKPLRETWFVYIVRCLEGLLYTGIAKDVSRRCQQHNAGTASRYTRSRLPVKVVYQEPQLDRSSALKRELAIKAMTRKEKLALIRLKKKAG